MKSFLGALIGFGMMVAQAGAATVFTYQGELQDSSEPFTGTVEMDFRLYQNETGGGAIDVRTEVVEVSGGLFQVELDFGNQPYEEGLWLGVSVGGENLEPRQRIAASPFAIRSLTGGSWSEESNGVIRYMGGTVAITPNDFVSVTEARFIVQGTISQPPMVIRGTGGAPAMRVNQNQSVSVGANYGATSIPDRGLRVWGPTILDEGLSVEGLIGFNTNSPTRMLHMKGDTDLTPTMLLESEDAPEDRRVAALFMNVTTGHLSIGRMTDDATALASTHFQIRSDNGHVGIGRTGGGISHPLHMASGAHVTAGGTWTNSSDADAKTDFQPMSPDEILAGVAQMPITYWEYKNDQGVRHLGPTAQDFSATFQLGNGDKTISTVDANGVALAAIQGLYRMVESERARVMRLEEQNRALSDQLDELKIRTDHVEKLADVNERLEARLAVLETLLVDQGQVASSN